MNALRTLALAITIICFAASCSKNDDHQPAIHKVSFLGRWDVSTIVTLEQNNDTSTYTGKDGDFIEFKTDGTVSSSIEGYELTQQYKMVDGTYIDYGGSIREIKEITSNKMVLYDPAHEGQSENITYTLTR